jgi:hypothetical protein
LIPQFYSHRVCPERQGLAPTAFCVKRLEPCAPLPPQPNWSGAPGKPRETFSAATSWSPCNLRDLLHCQGAVVRRPFSKSGRGGTQGFEGNCTWPACHAALETGRGRTAWGRTRVLCLERGGLARLLRHLRSSPPPFWKWHQKSRRNLVQISPTNFLRCRYWRHRGTIQQSVFHAELELAQGRPRVMWLGTRVERTLKTGFWMAAETPMGRRRAMGMGPQTELLRRSGTSQTQRQRRCWSSLRMWPAAVV